MKSTLDSKWIATVLFLMAVLLGCNYLRPGSKSPASSGNQSNSSQPSSAFNPSGDARQNLRDAYLKLKTAYPYRLTETTTMSGGQAPAEPVIRVVEFAAPDRVHAKLAGVETITIGDKHYWNYGGKWTETGEQPKKASAADMEKLMASFVKDVQPAGAETVNGVPCFAYAIRYEGDWSGQPATGTGKTWIGLADGRVHQNDGELKITSYTTKSHIVYEYNVDIKVEKPVP